MAAAVHVVVRDHGVLRGDVALKYLLQQGGVKGIECARNCAQRGDFMNSNLRSQGTRHANTGAMAHPADLQLVAQASLVVGPFSKVACPHYVSKQ
eukprot:6184049-Pleurochrysis_carterae.AAC.1